MTRKIFSYPKPLPDLTVEHLNSRGLGRCYTKSMYRITADRKLPPETIRALRDAGLIGSGQSVRLQEVTSEPILVDCVAFDADTGEPIPGPAINPYSGQPYGPSTYTYYHHMVEVLCDSGD